MGMKYRKFRQAFHQIARPVEADLLTILIHPFFMTVQSAFVTVNFVNKIIILGANYVFN
jgi:hypothetical protein